MKDDQIQAILDALDIVVGLRQIIEKNRKPNGEEEITYVMKDGQRIRATDHPLASLCKTLTEALEGCSDTAVASILVIKQMQEENESNAKLHDLCKTFIEKQRITCAEVARQEDWVYENSGQFIEDVANIVGYHKYEDDE